MSFLTDYGGERADRRPPARIYARIDTIEPLESAESRGPTIPRYSGSRHYEDEVLLLDSVDADWFDRLQERSLLELSGEADWNISVLETNRADIDQVASGEPLVEGTWLEVGLATPGNGPPVSHYLNLYGPPDEQSILSAQVLPDVEHELSRKTSMHLVPDASVAELAAVLPSFETDAAAVYDVGQGNCNALLNSGVPRLYYDFGGGVTSNRRSFPSALKSFCFTHEPTIVLSHWDWDHWSSANRQPEAYQRTWIVPREPKSLGPVHATFLGRLLQTGTVLVWPSGLAKLARGSYELIKCTGPPRSRNDSGLAMRVEHNTGSDVMRMLFPGDAAYDYIPADHQYTLSALVAAHHGAKTGTSQIPNPSGAGASLVYSYGAGNRYPHPSPAGRAAHASWQHVLETAHRDATDLGHVHLYWDANAPDATPPCDGLTCQLTCHQR